MRKLRVFVGSSLPFFSFQFFEHRQQKPVVPRRSGDSLGPHRIDSFKNVVGKAKLKAAYLSLPRRRLSYAAALADEGFDGAFIRGRGAMLGL